MPIIQYVQKYFWDIDPQKAQPKKHSEYYIKRILEIGDKKSYNWLKIVFGKNKIKSVIKKNNLSSKSQNYWELSHV